jgi:hypothetical protein
MKVELNEMKDKITGMEGRMKVRQDYFSSLQLCMEMN